MIRAALTAFALLAATPAFAQEAAPKYYRLDISVVRKGVEVVSTHTQIVEGYPAGASATLGDVTYDFEANLFSVQATATPPRWSSRPIWRAAKARSRLHA